MKRKMFSKACKFISSLMVVLIACSMFALAASEYWVHKPMSPSNINVKIAEHVKTVKGTTYDRFKWVSCGSDAAVDGDPNEIRVWVVDLNGTTIANKVEFSRAMMGKYVMISYDTGLTFQIHNTAIMRAEQGNILTKTLEGYAEFS